MAMHKRFFFVVFLSLACTLPVLAAAEPPAGRLLASQCAQCHGTDGNAVGEIESLAGKAFRELYDELLDMKSSHNTGDIMHRQARGYSDAQLRLIAEYYAGLRPGSSGVGAQEPNEDEDED